ncbi:MAG TPA: hypothetical protein VN885_04080 [Candidatus Acidoferrales bacterium]|nr:hypothetical protein [Candidatus Acidoferrales bacterium]
MNLHLNYTRKDSAPSSSGDVVATVLSLLEEGHINAAQFAHLQIHLDWLQYKYNFREPVTLMHAGEEAGPNAPPMEIRIDSRQVAPGSLRNLVERAIAAESPDSAERQGRIYFEDYQSFRKSIVWQFNRLYWQRVKDWEKATGKGYEQALPGGKSTGTDVEGVKQSVEEFWKLLKELETASRLPQEIFILEIGVGMGAHAGLWLDHFSAMDQARGTNFYHQLRFLLGDYSLATLEHSRPAVKKHLDLCSFIALDATDPIKTLSFLRHKILHVHSTNMYDNLPDEEIVWRDNRIFWVESRAYLPAADAARISEATGVAIADIVSTVDRLLDVGIAVLPDRAKGMQFWMQTWRAMRIEERLVDAIDLPDASFPAGLSALHMEEILRYAPNDLRIHLSTGALDSFRNTLPLLHPRGYLQVQDIFVTDLQEYSMGFHGPGKLDGSIVNWVNGALLREVAERAGYDLHFTPFQHRAGTKTSVLYTTRRE